jgi:RNA polymerase sigma-70 factor (ECF subfamily)
MSADLPYPDRVRNCAQRLAEFGVDALGALYDLTSHRLVRYSVTLTRNQHDAEDAVQSVLVRVADRPQLLAQANCSWAYLLRMVRNESLGIGRRKQRWSMAGGITDLLTRRCVDELEREDTHRAVWQALRKLPSEQAEVVVLKIWEEMTFAQIADVLEISRHTAASRYKYAIEKLTHKLAPMHREARHE